MKIEFLIIFSYLNYNSKSYKIIRNLIYKQEMYSGSPKTEAKGGRSVFFDENFPDKRSKNIDNEFTGI